VSARRITLVSATVEDAGAALADPACPRVTGRRRGRVEADASNHRRNISVCLASSMANMARYIVSSRRQGRTCSAATDYVERDASSPTMNRGRTRRRASAPPRTSPASRWHPARSRCRRDPRRASWTSPTASTAPTRNRGPGWTGNGRCPSPDSCAAADSVIAHLPRSSQF